MVTTSGTFNFAPNTGLLLQSAYGRLGIRRSALTAEHWQDGQQEANLWLVDAANRGPNLWTVDQINTPLTQGNATYAVDPSTVMMLDVNIVYSPGGSPISRVLQSLSRSDYSDIPDKTQQGPPTSFWFNRQIAPTVTMWPTPDGGGPYTLSFWRYRQMQDAGLQGGQNVELPYLFLDAFVAGLAYRLAKYYAPALESARKVDSAEAWASAAEQNTEAAPVSIAPQISSFYR